jgi:hypothetical protein
MNKFIIILSLIIFACNNTKEKESLNANEIEKLNTIEKQKNYLLAISSSDQTVRESETEAVTKFGYDSKEHKAAIDKMFQIDIGNLTKIEAYLKKYGYPSKDKYGKEACSTPWIVVHHAPDGIESRLRNFKYMYDAYKKGDLDSGQMSFYLNRMYRIKYNKELEWNRPFRVEEELDTLYKTLDLLPIMNTN